MIKGSFVLDATVSYDVVLRFVIFFSFILFTYYLICGQISTTRSATETFPSHLCAQNLSGNFSDAVTEIKLSRLAGVSLNKRYRLNKRFWIGHWDFTDPSLKAPLMTCNPQVPTSRRFVLYMLDISSSIIFTLDGSIDIITYCH